MYLKKVQVCPNCHCKAKITKQEQYGDGMIKYSFHCPKCNLRYASSWKKTQAE